MNRTIVYGIPNCDTVKKARAWLAGRGVEVAFHDYKKQGVPEAELSGWVKALGWEALLNRKGSTWRKLDPARQAQVTDAGSAIALMLAQPSVIRRPVLVRGDVLSVGFDADDWAALFR
ncbi:MAG: ArsC family reductase [Piscinibacter sp.]|uniref:ArsC family reductase n=1 Tax=Piscinibacter sp. TaxID=1903157 RepID=UPI003D116B15